MVRREQHKGSTERQTLQIVGISVTCSLKVWGRTKLEWHPCQKKNSLWCTSVCVFSGMFWLDWSACVRWCRHCAAGGMSASHVCQKNWPCRSRSTQAAQAVLWLRCPLDGTARLFNFTLSSVKSCFYQKQSKKIKKIRIINKIESVLNFKIALVGLWLWNVRFKCCSFLQTEVPVSKMLRQLMVKKPIENSLTVVPCFLMAHLVSHPSGISCMTTTKVYKSCRKLWSYAKMKSTS